MTQRFAIFLFASASLLPAGVIIAAGLMGGGWAYAALLCMTVFVFAADRLGPALEAHASLTRWLPWMVSGLHFAALFVTLWSLREASALDASQKIALAAAMGLFAGQVSNACAHELIHRSDRAARWLGTVMYCSILNGQHVSAHMLLHHVHAGTEKDPCSAPLGRGFYRFAIAATYAEFFDGWRAETRRRSTNAGGLHPYATYVSGAAISVTLAALLGGALGAIGLLAISAHAQMQLLLSDYVQHYGLRRKKFADGRYEPMGPEHSWNAPQTYSAAMMMNATRHSDHHMKPSRAFPDLYLSNQTMPMLPRSMPVMGAIALVPPLWRTLMDPRVAKWSRDVSHPVPTSVAHPLMSR